MKKPLKLGGKTKIAIGIASVSAIVAGAVVPLVLNTNKSSASTTPETPQNFSTVEQREQNEYEVAYSTEVEKLPLPAQKEGYESPVLEARRTTYSKQAETGTKGLQVAFLYKSTKKNQPDVVVVFNVKVKKPDPVTVDLTGQQDQKITVTYGMPLGSLPVPEPKTGFKTPVLLKDDAKTTYRPDSTVGSVATVAYEYESENKNQANLIEVYGVEIKKGPTVTNDWSAQTGKPVVSIVYGTPWQKVSVPVAQSGYKDGTIVLIEPTTYSPTSPVKTKGKIAFKYANENPNLPDGIVVYAFEVKKGEAVVNDLSMQIEKRIKVKYKTALAMIAVPIVPNMKPGLLFTDPNYTTYTPDSGIDSATKIAFKHEADDPNQPDYVFVYGVEVTKEPDQTVDLRGQEGKAIEAVYGTTVGSVHLPAAIQGYKMPRRILDKITDYTFEKPVGSVSSIAFLYEPDDPNLPTITYIYDIKTVKAPARSEDLSADPKTKPLEVFYGTELNQITLPANATRAGYNFPPMATKGSDTTYSTQTAVGTTSKIAFTYTATNPNNPDLIVVYAIKVTRAGDIVNDYTTQTEKTITVLYGTAPDQISKPEKKTGYKDPVLIVTSGQTTYSSTSAINSKTRLAFKHESENPNLPDLIEIFTVQVKKIDDQINKSHLTVAYGTPVEQIGRPSKRPNNYGAPFINVAKTTYTKTSKPGTAGMIVQWKMISDNPADPEIIYEINVTIQKQADQSETTSEATTTYGTPAEQIGKPAKRDGYAEPVLEPQRTTYTDRSPVNSPTLSVVWKLANNDTGASDVYVTVPVKITKGQPQVADYTSNDEKQKTVEYGTPSDSIVKPTDKPGYKKPVLVTNPAQTTYTSQSPAGSIAKVAYSYENENPDLPDYVEVYAVQITKAADQIVSTTASTTYGTSPEQIGKPSPEKGYVLPVIDAKKTTYSSSSAAGTKGLVVVWRMANDNASAADKIYVVAVAVTRQGDKSETAAEVTVIYGTPAEQIGKPARRDGYAEPVIDPQRTTYTDRSPVNSPSLSVVWKLANNDAGASDVYVTVPVKVIKEQPQVVDYTGNAEKQKTVEYGTAPDSIAKPADRPGYKKPVLVKNAAQTTYTSQSPAGSIAKVAYSYENENPNLPDYVEIYPVQVTKAADQIFSTTASTNYGTSPDQIGKPAPEKGYGLPVIDARKTTYNSGSAAGTKGLVVVWRMANDNAGAADKIHVVAVTVTKPDDKSETSTEVTTTYGTPAEQIGKPEKRSGYKEAVVEDQKTTYKIDSPVDSPGLQIVWRLQSTDGIGGDILVTVPVKIKKADPKVADYTDPDQWSSKIISVIYGTPLVDIPKPASIAGYKQPVVLTNSNENTYKPNLAAGVRAKVAFKYEPENPNLPDYVEIRTVEVQKQPDEIHDIDATVKSGTPIDEISKPAEIKGYLGPFTSNETNYTEDTPPGEGNPVLVWRFITPNENRGEILYKIHLTVRPKDKVINENNTVEIEEGSDIKKIPVPSKPFGNYEDAIIHGTTDYTPEKKAGQKAKAAYLFASKDPSQPDVLKVVSVRVTPKVGTNSWVVNYVWRSHPKQGYTIPYNVLESVKLPDNKTLTNRQIYLNGLPEDSTSASNLFSRMADGDYLDVVYEIKDASGQTLKDEKLIVRFKLDTSSQKDSASGGVFTSWSEYKSSGVSAPAGYELANTAYYMQVSGSYANTLITESQARLLSSSTLVRIVQKYEADGKDPYYVQCHIVPTSNSAASISQAIQGKKLTLYGGKTVAFYEPMIADGFLWSSPMLKIIKYVSPDAPGYDRQFDQPNRPINEQEVGYLPVGTVIAVTYTSFDKSKELVIEYELTGSWDSPMVSELDTVIRDGIVPTHGQYVFGTKPSEQSVKPGYKTLKTELQFAKVEEEGLIPGYFKLGMTFTNPEVLITVPIGTKLLLRYKITGTIDGAPLPPEQFVDHYLTVVENTSFKDSDIRKITQGKSLIEIGQEPANLSGYGAVWIDEFLSTYNENYGVGQKNLTVVYRYDAQIEGGLPTYAAFPVEIVAALLSLEDIAYDDYYSYTVGAPLPAQDEYLLKLPKGYLIREKPKYYTFGSDEEATAAELNKLWPGDRFKVVYQTTLDEGYLGKAIKVSITYTVNRTNNRLFTVIQSPRTIGKKQRIADLVKGEPDGSYAITYGAKGNGTNTETFPVHYDDIYASDPSVSSYWAWVTTSGTFTFKGAPYDARMVRLVFISKDEENPKLPAKLEDYPQSFWSIEKLDSVWLEDAIENPLLHVIKTVDKKANNYNPTVQENMANGQTRELPAGTLFEYIGSVKDPIDNTQKPFAIKIAVRPKTLGQENEDKPERKTLIQYQTLPLKFPKQRYSIQVISGPAKDPNDEFAPGKTVKYPALVSRALPGTILEVTYWSDPDTNDDQTRLVAKRVRELVAIVPPSWG